MRYLLIALALVVALLYSTVGLRLGYVTLTRTYMWNATGLNTYSLRTVEDGQRIGVTGSCEVRGGAVTIRLASPAGNSLAGQVCSGNDKRWALNVTGRGPAGIYRLTVDLEKFTGSLDLRETLAGK